MCAIEIVYASLYRQFIGAKDAVEGHIRSCEYENMKGVFQQTDERIETLTRALAVRDKVGRHAQCPVPSVQARCVN